MQGIFPARVDGTVTTAMGRKGMAWQRLQIRRRQKPRPAYTETKYVKWLNCRARKRMELLGSHQSYRRALYAVGRISSVAEGFTAIVGPAVSGGGERNLQPPCSAGCSSPQSVSGMSSGGLPFRARIQLIARFIPGRRMRRHSSRRLPGKLSRVRAMTMVISP